MANLTGSALGPVMTIGRCSGSEKHARSGIEAESAGDNGQDRDLGQTGRESSLSTLLVEGDGPVVLGLDSSRPDEDDIRHRSHGLENRLVIGVAETEDFPDRGPPSAELMKLTSTQGRPSAFRSLMKSPTRSSTGSPDSVLRSIGRTVALLLDDERSPSRTCPRPLHVSEDVAVPNPDARVLELHQDRVALTRGDVEGVYPIRVVQGCRLGRDQLTELVLMHSVDLQPLVVVMDDDPIAHLPRVGLVAGNDLPLRLRPITPASLRTMGISCATWRSVGISTPEMVWPTGIATSPTMKVPNNPLGTCICP